MPCTPPCHHLLLLGLICISQTPRLHTNAFPHEEGRTFAPAKSHCLHRTGTADSTIRYPVWNQPKQEFPLRDGGTPQAPGLFWKDKGMKRHLVLHSVIFGTGFLSDRRASASNKDADVNLHGVVLG